VSTMATSSAQFGSATAQGVTLARGTIHILREADILSGDPYRTRLDRILVTELPFQGTLTLNGTPIRAGDLIPIAAINAGQLVYTAPDMPSSRTEFAFRLQGAVGPEDGRLSTDPTPRKLIFTAFTPGGTGVRLHEGHTARRNSCGYVRWRVWRRPTLRCRRR